MPDAAHASAMVQEIRSRKGMVVVIDPISPVASANVLADNREQARACELRRANSRFPDFPRQRKLEI
jgi:hypothetical protein